MQLFHYIAPERNITSMNEIAKVRGWGLLFFEYFLQYSYLKLFEDNKSRIFLFEIINRYLIRSYAVKLQNIVRI